MSLCPEAEVVCVQVCVLFVYNASVCVCVCVCVLVLGMFPPTDVRTSGLANIGAAKSL